MVDFTNTTNRCILHVEGNDDYYSMELSTDDHFNEEEFIAIYKYLYKAMKEQIDLNDLKYDDDEEILEYCGSLENDMHKFFIDIGLPKESIKNIINSSYFYFIPSYEYLVNIITEVKLYKIEDNHMYNYTIESGWSLIF